MEPDDEEQDEGTGRDHARLRATDDGPGVVRDY